MACIYTFVNKIPHVFRLRTGTRTFYGQEGVFPSVCELPREPHVSKYAVQKLGDNTFVNLSLNKEVWRIEGGKSNFSFFPVEIYFRINKQVLKSMFLLS